MGVLVEVGEGGTGDKVVDYGSLRCSSGLPYGRTRNDVGVEIAYNQTVALYGDNV
jgi:hypothetical protein